MVEKYLEEVRNGDDLKNYVIDYYIENYKDSTMEKMILAMEDLMKYGCISGIIPNLIYYEDTTNFYDKYKNNINKMVSNIGIPMEEIFGDKFDKEDPLVLDITNKNLLAWFGFEETASQIYEQIIENVNSNQYDYSY